MFVAASVGAGVFTREKQVGLRTFLSPTVVAFSAVLATSLVAVLPMSAAAVPALLLAGIGLLGLAYSWRVWRRMVGGGIVPGVGLGAHTGWACALLAGIRNAWDMTTWVVLRRES